jgi:hypothetical protein
MSHWKSPTLQPRACSISQIRRVLRSLFWVQKKSETPCFEGSLPLAIVVQTRGDWESISERSTPDVPPSRTERRFGSSSFAKSSSRIVHVPASSPKTRIFG